MTRVHRCLAILTLLTGCGQQLTPVPPVEPATAREALRTALDAWQRGDAPESLRDRSPAIIVNDHDWNNGRQLAEFTITGEGQPIGADLVCPVELTLQNVKGEPQKKNARYRVGTDRALTVIREDEGS